MIRLVQEDSVIDRCDHVQLIRRLADSLEMCLPDVRARGGKRFAELLEGEIAEARGVLGDD